eukprot:scaffold14976_cov73-Isochrysis_galbana.AAC.1
MTTAAGSPSYASIPEGAPAPTSSPCPLVDSSPRSAQETRRRAANRIAPRAPQIDPRHRSTRTAKRPAPQINPHRK